MVGAFLVIIKSSVRLRFSGFDGLDVEIENIEIRKGDFYSFGFLKIHTLS